MQLDLLVKGGTVVDGSGGPRRRADVGISGGRIVAVEPAIEDTATRVIDATDRIVTPGFVDVHTHLDAHLTWDPLATPSTWHGVTSVVTGNSGVTFAPVRPGDRECLAGLLERFGGIPGTTISDALPWEWETYGEYLGWLGSRPLGPNVGGLVGHCAIRQYVMGEGGLTCRGASAGEIVAMAGLVDEAMSAGALGFSTSRTLFHRVPSGEPVPGTWAEPAELLAIADVLGRHGRGVFAAASRLGGGEDDALGVINAELAWMGEASRRSGRPVSFALAQVPARPDLHRSVIALTKAENGRGALLRPQTTASGLGILFGLETRTPFDTSPAWRELRSVRNGGKLLALRDQQRRCTLIAEAELHPPLVPLDRLWVLPPNGPARYDCPLDETLVAHAGRRGVSPAAAYIELLLETDGQLICTHPFLNPCLDAVGEMLDDPLVTLGLGASGAHVGTIMEAGQPTFLLTYWVRDQGRWALEEAVRRLTSDPAGLFGLVGRGLLRPGAHADVNVIDLERLSLEQPSYVTDLPGGTGRYIQRSSGYDWTIVNGDVLLDHGEHTGALPGVVLRGG